MRIVFVVAVVVLVAACRKPAEVPSPVDAGVVKAALEFAAPTASSTLSVFEPAGTSCEWRQVEPVTGTKVVLASFPGTCVGARVSFSPDATKAVVWFDPKHVQRAGYSSNVSSKPGFPDETVDETASARAFVVSTRKQQQEVLTFPSVPKAELRELGVDAKGAVLALLEEALPDGAQGTIESGGEKFDLSTVSEGIPVLVHAYRRDGAQWTRVETRLSTTGWDYGLDVQALEVHRTLGPRSVDLASAHAQGDAADLKALEALTPKGAGEEDGSWIFLGAGGARLYVWEMRSEFAYTTGLLAGADAKPLPKLGFTDGDLVAVRTSAAHVLVSAADVGTHPRLYQYPSAKLLFSSDTARAVTFWPTTARPESHEAP
jgi:hypothetical protein